MSGSNAPGLNEARTHSCFAHTAEDGTPYIAINSPGLMGAVRNVVIADSPEGERVKFLRVGAPFTGDQYVRA